MDGINMRYFGQDGWRRGIFFERGKPYRIVRRPRSKGNSLVVEVRKDGKLAILSYRSEKEFKEEWIF